MTRTMYRAQHAHQFTPRQPRADWRDVLTARDAKRSARRASMARRAARRQSGHISRGLILCLILTCALAMGLTAWDAAQRAVSAIVSHQV